MTLPRYVGLLLLAIACAHALLPAVRDGAALHDLLGTAVDRSVARLAREGGFDEESAAGSDVGAELGPLARALHGVGMGERVLALQTALQRAAERATADVGPWLHEEAERFAPDDPDALLDGPPGSATLAFRANVESGLAERLAPAAEKALTAADVPAALASVREGAARLPLSREVTLDPAALVNERVRTAFFAVLADEEAELRTNVSAGP